MEGKIETELRRHQALDASILVLFTIRLVLLLVVCRGQGELVLDMAVQAVKQSSSSMRLRSSSSNAESPPSSNGSSSRPPSGPSRKARAAAVDRQSLVAPGVILIVSKDIEKAEATACSLSATLEEIDIKLERLALQDAPDKEIRSGLETQRAEATSKLKDVLRVKEEKLRMLHAFTVHNLSLTPVAPVTSGDVVLPPPDNKYPSLSSAYASASGVLTGFAPAPYFVCDPTRGKLLTARLIPQSLEGGVGDPLPMHAVIPMRQSLQCTSETKSVTSSNGSARTNDLPSWGTVEEAFVEMVDPLFKIDADDVSREPQKSLAWLQVPSLFFSADSILDLVTLLTYRGRRVPLAVVEFMAGCKDVLEGLGQASQGASCVAAGLVNCGMAWQDVTVSFTICNGHSIMFGGVHMVAPALPMPYVTSTTLSLMDYKDVYVVHRHLLQHEYNTERLAQAVRDAFSSSVPAMGSGLESAFVAAPQLHFQVTVPVSVFCKRNVIRVESNAPFRRHRSSMRSSTWDASVCALFAVYNRLFFCGASDVVVFPFGIGRALTPANAGYAVDKQNVKALLLPDLRHETPPFKSAPPRDRRTAWCYVNGVAEAVRKIHSAGVVHGDLYLSNIMYRWYKGRLEIKVIDLDISFFITAPVPDAYDLGKRNLYRLCEDEQRRSRVCDTKALNSTLDLAEIHAMRLCLCDEDGYARWQHASMKEDPGELNIFSRWMGERYDETLTGKTFTDAMAAGEAVNAAGTAHCAVPAGPGAQWM